MFIYRYILKSHFAPFILSFFIVIFVFTFQFIIRFIDTLVGKGLSIWVISQLIALNMAWMVTLAGPMAALVASLMAFGTMSSTNEITAMKATGISLPRMMLPVLICAGIVCYGLVLFNNKVLPESNHRTKVLMSDIQRTKPTFVLEQGRFSDDLGGNNILVKKTFPESNNLEGVLIIDNSNPAYSSLLTAERGSITFSTDYSKVILELHEGEIHRMQKEKPFEDYRKIVFEKHIVSIDASGFGFSNSDQNQMSRGDRELSADSMRGIIASIKVNQDKDITQLKKNIETFALEFSRIKFDTVLLKTDSVARIQNEVYIQTLVNKYRSYKQQLKGIDQRIKNDQKTIDQYQVEIYKKYSIPFACIVFVLIGAPLGVRTRKGGFGVAAGISLGFFLLYWVCLIGGEKLADREMLSPFLSMWIANIILGITGVFLVLNQTYDLKSILGLRKK